MPVFLSAVRDYLHLNCINMHNEIILYMVIALFISVLRVKMNFY